MPVGEIFGGFFGRNSAKELADPAKRLARIEQAYEEVRKAATSGAPVEEVRKPVLALAEEFEAARQDPAEIYGHLHQAVPGDPYWRTLLVRELLKRPRLQREHVAVLEAEALFQTGNIALWRRLLREAANNNDSIALGRAYENIVFSLKDSFPAPGDVRWYDQSTREDALKLFRSSLDAAAGRIRAVQRSDDKARMILALKEAYDGEEPSPESLLAKARDAMARGLSDGATAGLGMRALLANPEDRQLKSWVASLLLRQPGLEEEGLELCRQLCEQDPRDPVVVRELVSALKAIGPARERDLPALRTHIAHNPDDQRALELLADYYAQTDDTSDEALEAYRAAAASSPNRGHYLRLLGKVQTSRGNWSTALDIFKELQAEGVEDEEVLIPLAAAYAEFGRADQDAIDVYKRAIAMGCQKMEVHDLYCRHLYMRHRGEPESITQFAATRKQFPRSMWARLGTIDHLIASGDHVRALEIAVGILGEMPRDLEAQKFASHALAGNFSRTQMRLVASLPPEAQLGVLEKAHLLAEDAMPITQALVRLRLETGVRDEDTARLLGDLCRRNPDALDLRMARADLLYDLGKHESAVELYRELLDRHRAGGANASMAAILKPDMRDRMLERVAGVLQRNPGPGDIDLLLEATTVPSAPPEWLHTAARILVIHRLEHPLRMATLERAASFFPEDDMLERALVESKAHRGNPRPALKYIAKRLEQTNDDPDLGGLMRATATLLQPEQVGEDLAARMFTLLEAGRKSPELREGMVEILAKSRMPMGENTEFFEALLRHAPKHTDLLMALGACYEAAGRDARAAECYERASVSAVADPGVVLRIARLDARIQRHDQNSLRVAEKAVALAPEDADLMLHLAACRLEVGQLEGAEAIFRQLLGRGDASLAARILALLENCLAVSTSQPDLLILHVRACIRLGRIEQALSALGRLQPHYQRLFPQLLDTYTDLIEAAPENPRARMERSVLWRLSGHLPEACEDLAEAYRLAPDNAGIVSEYAEVLGQKLAEENSRDAAQWARLGDLLFEVGDPDGAMEACINALEADPRDEGSLLLLAQVQLETGAVDLCRDTLRRLPRSPRVFKLLQRLARAYEDRDDHTAAAQVLTEALDMSGGQRELIERLRELHSRAAETAREASERREVLAALSSSAQKRYDLREEIGRGTMGLVFKAYDRELDEIVVLKILPEHFANNAEMVARFRLEAKAARKLAHPNIVRIHDIGEEGGRKHLSMEYVGGGDLKAALRMRGRFSPAEATRIVREIARALVHAHGEGVLHRDIKPANILLTKGGRVKLSDFGIAAMFADAGEAGSFNSRSSSDAVAGTPLYMSPEQFTGQALGPTSDLYSLGVIYYELMAGHAPFTRGSVSYHHQYTMPDPIADIPLSVWQIVARLLAKDPAQRYQSAAELLAALDNAGVDDADGRSPVPRGASSISEEPTPMPLRRRDPESPQ